MGKLKTALAVACLGLWSQASWAALPLLGLLLGPAMDFVGFAAGAATSDSGECEGGKSFCGGPAGATKGSAGVFAGDMKAQGLRPDALVSAAFPWMNAQDQLELSGAVQDLGDGPEGASARARLADAAAQRRAFAALSQSEQGRRLRHAALGCARMGEEELLQARAGALAGASPLPPMALAYWAKKCSEAAQGSQAAAGLRELSEALEAKAKSGG